MTLCVAVTTADGLVMGADSMTFVRDAALQKSYFNANKVFELPGLPIVVMTYGLGALGRRSIGSLIEEWADGRPDYGNDFTVMQVANDICDWVFKRHRAYRAEVERALEALRADRLAAQTPDALETSTDRPPEVPAYTDEDWSTGLIVGGYEPGSFFPWLWTYEEPRSSALVAEGLHCPRPHEGAPDGDEGPASGLDWWGDAEALRRLVGGFDPDLIRELGVDDASFQSTANAFKWPVAYEGMPIQDAVNLAEFLLQVGCGYERFKAGDAFVGGEVDIAVVGRRGIHWKNRKPLTEAMSRRTERQ